MDTFEYKGRNKRGEILQGTIEAVSPQSVANWMLAAGIVPIRIRAREDRLKNQPDWLIALQGGNRVSVLDLQMFTRQMATMIKAGVPMMDALAGIQRSTGSEVLARTIKAMRADLDKGVQLSGAMARHPLVFSDYYVSMVRVGEGSGQLEEVFRRLFQQLEFDKDVRQKIKAAMRYPSFVLVAMAIAMTIMTIFVIPTFARVFASMKLELPLLTRMLLGFSGFMVDYWWLMLGAVGAGIYAFRAYTGQAEGRYQWDRLKLRFPVLGPIIKKAALARFCSSFATASRSGVPLIQAFTLVSQVVDNAFYADRILTMREGVERGETLLRVAQSTAIFTPIELQMLAVGEATGDIESMLMQVADMYQQEIDYEVSRLSASIEPILLAFLGVLVAILLLGIFMPLWDMTQLAHR